MYRKIGAVVLTGILWAGYYSPCPARSSQEIGQRQNCFHTIIVGAARRHQVEAEIIKAMIMVESEYDAEAVSESGARGLMQLMPSTAETLGVEDCFDPRENVEAGVAYFKMLKEQFNGNIILALAAYNAGPTRVRECGGIPHASTRHYILKVLNFYLIYKKQVRGWKN